MSCHDDEHENPSPAKSTRALKLEYDNYKKELIYNDEGILTQVKITSHYAGGDLVGTQSFVYKDGILTEAFAENDIRNVYTYAGNKIVRTDEYYGDHLSQYYTFDYSTEGKIVTMTIWQNIPEEGGEIPVQKSEYVYNAQGNIDHFTLFYFDSGSKVFRLLTKFEYSNYDQHENVDDYFDVIMANPYASFSNNNPGKMTVTNGNGITTVVENYSYTYDKNGLAIVKTTKSKNINDPETQYDTHYTFEVK